MFQVQMKDKLERGGHKQMITFKLEDFKDIHAEEVEIKVSRSALGEKDTFIIVDRIDFMRMVHAFSYDEVYPKIGS